MTLAEVDDFGVTILIDDVSTDSYLSLVSLLKINTQGGNK